MNEESRDYETTRLLARRAEAAIREREWDLALTLYGRVDDATLRRTILAKIPRAAIERRISAILAGDEVRFP